MAQGERGFAAQERNRMRHSKLCAIANNYRYIGITMRSALILNAGSSSVKFRFYHGNAILLDGVLDGIGGKCMVSYKERAENCEERHEYTKEIPDFNAAGIVLLSIIREAHGSHPDMIIHRIVHGGEYDEPMVITPGVLHELKGLIPLAPLHMTPAIEFIERFQQQDADAVHIAVFDTMFHQYMPEVAKTYAIPPKLARKHRIRRYGFHGIAYAEMVREAAKVINKPLSQLRIIACQLGNGASVCAIRHGRSIDTSMGFTPLEGLMMGTRSGDIDPAVIPFLCEHEHLAPDQALRVLQHESGLKGMAGEWDVRKLLKREREGDDAAKFALDLFAYRVRKYVGAYIAALGGVDVIVLSGGVSRAPKMRQRILSGLEELGIELDHELVQREAPALVSRGRVKVIVIEVDEQEMMRKIVQHYLRAHELLEKAAIVSKASAAQRACGGRR
jgi:acetate kinase